MTTSRTVCFAIAFCFTLPIMVLMFRDDAGVSRNSWIQAVIFAAVMAVVVTVFFGKSKR